MRPLDITGQRFGRLTACERVATPKSDGKKNAWWECVCECGERIRARATHLRGKQVRSCGCLKRPDLWGQRFGRLVVEELAPEKNEHGFRPWICKCDCGATAERSSWQLQSGETTSCGCAMRDAQAAFGQRSNGAIRKARTCPSP